MIVRAAGDEAATSLVFMQFISWVTEIIWSIIAKLKTIAYYPVEYIKEKFRDQSNRRKKLKEMTIFFILSFIPLLFLREYQIYDVTMHIGAILKIIIIVPIVFYASATILHLILLAVMWIISIISFAIKSKYVTLVNRLNWT